jgi:hypothetical protein
MSASSATPRTAVVYHSGYGHTTRLAEAVAQGASASLLAIDADGNLPEEAWTALDSADAIIFGSPTYMGGPSWQFKRFADASSKAWFELKWKDSVDSRPARPRTAGRCDRTRAAWWADAVPSGDVPAATAAFRRYESRCSKYRCSCAHLDQQAHVVGGLRGVHLGQWQVWVPPYWIVGIVRSRIPQSILIGVRSPSCNSLRRKYCF